MNNKLQNGLSLKIILHHITCIIFCLLYIFNCNNELHAENLLIQKLNQQWRWTKYTSDDGLASTKIIDLIETNDNTIWALTSDGLSWFNGFQWITLKDKVVFKKRSFFAISAGKKNEIVFAANDYFYKINKSGIIKERLYYQNELLKPKKIIYFHGDKYLILTSNKNFKLTLYIYEKGKISLIKIPSEFPLNSSSLHQIFRNTHGDVFINTFKGIFKWNDGKWDLFFASETLLELAGKNFNVDSAGNTYISIIYPKKYLGLWKISENGKVNQLSFANKRKDKLNIYFPKVGEGIITNPIGDVYFIEPGRIGHSDKLFVPEEIISYLEQAFCLLFTSDGNLFVGNDDGVSFCRLKSNLWEYLQTESRDFQSINEIIKVGNDIWAATGSGIVIFHNNGKIENIRRILNKSINHLTALLRDHVGDIWIGSGNEFKGLYRFHNNKWEFINDPLIRNYCYHKIYTDSKNRLWFLPIPYDPNEEIKFIPYYENMEFKALELPKNFHHKNFYSFAESLDGSLWFGHLNGLYKYKNKKWSLFTTEQGLLYNEIFSMDIDSNGYIWLASRFSGLCYIKNDKVKKIPGLEKIVLNGIWDIKFDSNGRLWIATKYGLYVYNNYNISAFKKNNGLSNTNLWPVKIFDDRLYVGSSAGIINILSLSEDTLPKPIIVFDHPTLDYNRAIIRFQAYSYMGKIQSGLIETRYKLDNNEWSPWSIDRKIDLINISSGDHEISLQTKNIFGTVSTEKYKYEFEVPSKFYKRMVFIIPVICLLIVTVLSIILFLRYVNKRQSSLILKQKNAEITKAINELSEKNKFITEQKEMLILSEQELKKANSDKDVFFSILAHELSNPYQGFKSLIKYFKENYSQMNQQEIEEVIDVLNISSEQLAGLLENLLLWSMSENGRIDFRPDFIILSDLINKNIEFYKIQCENKQIKLLNEFKKTQIIYADKNMIDTIIRNLLGNSIKFTPKDGIITISCHNADNKIYISISDSGIGISQEDIKKLFNIEYIHSTPGLSNEKGSGLGLVICKKFANMHDGDITVNSIIGKGSVFTISLPERSL